VSGGLLGRLRRIVTPAEDEATEREYRVRLVIGLGNPGSEYAANRHNIGYRVVNRLARRHGIELDVSGKASLGSGTIAGREVTLAKPRAFVNTSGPVVWNLVKRLKLDDARELLVVYDELDLPAGKIRLRPRGGHGGYKGLQSIIDAVGSDDFPRLRIGIGRPLANGEPSWEPDVVASHVLSDPPPDERELLDDAAERAADAIEMAIGEGIERAMQRYN
jgi:PTH1 family peptidyl-tRNA hydrolase